MFAAWSDDLPSVDSMTTDACPEPEVAAALPPATQVCVLIPARGGSRGVPGKNLRTVGGEPLIVRAVRQAARADAVDAVVVSTDDPAIAQAARAAGAAVVDRPAALAGDAASSESALLHALDVLDQNGVRPDIVVFVQATSPFIDHRDLGRAIDSVRRGASDVAFSVTRVHDHLWRLGPDGPEGVNHDARRRLRRQERQPQFRETGAFYVMRRAGLVEHGHRFFGRLELIEVDPLDSFEIDDARDLVLAEAIAAGRDLVDPAIAARAVVTDFDGVHTDDRVRVDEFGVESVEVSRSDGMGVSLLRRAEIPVLVLSTESNPVVEARARKLGVPWIAGCDDKLSALRAWADQTGVDLRDVAYLGNDVNDLACLRAVGWPIVPSDAHPAARAAAREILRRRGGDGVVRELADRVLLTVEEGLDHG